MKGPDFGDVLKIGKCFLIGRLLSTAGIRIPT
jgi:hypothetical protein